jgi:hypothetical protein
MKALELYTPNTGLTKLDPTVEIGESEFYNKEGDFTISINLEYPERCDANQALIDLKNYIFETGKKAYLYSHYPNDTFIEDYDLIVTYPIISHHQLKCNIYLTRDQEHSYCLRNLCVDKNTRLTYLIYAPTAIDKPVVYKYKRKRLGTTLRYEFELQAHEHVFKQITLTAYVDEIRRNNVGRDCPYIFKASTAVSNEYNPIQVTQKPEVTELLKQCAAAEQAYFQGN